MGDFKDYDDMMERVEKIRRGEQDNWTHYTNKEDTKLWYKQEEGKTALTIYMEKVIEAEPLNAASIIAECQTFKEWIPKVHKSEVLMENSHFRKCVELGITSTWPMQNRHQYMTVTALPIRGESSIIIMCKSLPSKPG